MEATPHLSCQGSSLMCVGGLDQYLLLTACDRDRKRFLKCFYIMKEDREHWARVLPLASHIFYIVPAVLFTSSSLFNEGTKQKFDLPTQVLFLL